MKKKLIVLSGFVFGLAPVVALAQVGTTGSTSGGCTVGSTGTLLGVLCRIGQILNAVVPVLIALGVVYFVWGVITYVIASDEEAKKAGRNRIIYGIIGLAVIVAVWGLVRILTNTFDVNNTGQITLPTIPINQQ
jgi:predicted membrane channel-forming protein YqfA (hemolysin III family)